MASSTENIASQHQPSQNYTNPSTSQSIFSSCNPVHYIAQLPQTKHSRSINYEHFSSDDMGEGKRKKRMSSYSSQSNMQHIEPLIKSIDPNKAKRKRPKFVRKVICQICGDMANDYMSYGAIACASCRAFFRRGVNNKGPYFCSQNQSCPITKQTRKNCQNCRFQKCVSIGMKGSCVMTEKDKLEKKEKAMMRRQWNQIKKYKNDPTSNKRVRIDAKPSNSNSTTSIQPTEVMPQKSVSKFESNPSDSSLHAESIQNSSLGLKTELDTTSDANLRSAYTSILPSAAATTRAVVTAAEHDAELSQIADTENIIPFEDEIEGGEQQTNSCCSSSKLFTNHSKYMHVGNENNHENVSVKKLHAILPYRQSQKITTDESAVNVCHEYDDIPYRSSNIAEFFSNFCPAGEDLLPLSRRTQRNSVSTLLLKGNGKFPFGSTLLNEPVMPFTREEDDLVANMIEAEKLTTHQTPISNKTLRVIMQAVKTGTTLSHKATLEGYTFCMKRIIKFASRIDLFREFSLMDQKKCSLITSTC